MYGNFSGPSWHVTTVSILAGMGAGYVVGILTARWWRWKGRRSHTSQLDGGVVPSVESHTTLVAAISDLTSQVRNLQAAVSEILQRTGRRSRTTGAESVVSEFVSARGDNPDSDDEFFDMDSGQSHAKYIPNVPWSKRLVFHSGKEDEDDEQVFTGSPHSIEYFDELGKSTLESEDVCRTLAKELKLELVESPDSVHLLWRLSRVLVHLSIHCDQQVRGEEERQLLVEATEHAQKALGLDDGVWQSHQWYAIALGSQLKHEGTQRKITAGYEYKEHIDRAISLNPSDPNLFYLRGRWEYEVAALSWLEKKAASALYATPPDATFDEALEDFMRVEGFNGGGVWKANLMMVAKCHIKLGDMDAAIDWLQKSRQLAVVTSEDKATHKEVEELITTYAAT